CLVKDVRKRLADIRTASFILDNSPKLTDSATSDTASTTARLRDLRTIMRRRTLLGTVAGLAVGAGVSGALVWVSTRSTPPRVVRAAIPATGSAALTISSVDRDLAITPDGRRLVYVGNNSSQLFARPLDQLEPTALVTLSAQERALGRLRG